MRELANTVGYNYNYLDHDFSPEHFVKDYKNFLKENKETYNVHLLSVSEPTLKRWWTGESFPDPDSFSDFFRYMPNLIGKWRNRYNFKCRLQRYMASLDLQWIRHESKFKDFALKEAENILSDIHRDWRIDETGLIAIQGPHEKNIGNPFNKFGEFRAKLHGIDSKKIEFGTKLGYRSFVYPALDLNQIHFYRLDSKSSVLPHLLWLAINLEPSGPKCHLALILDLLSAANAAETLDYYNIDPPSLGKLVQFPGPKITEGEWASITAFKIFTRPLREPNDDQAGPCIFEGEDIYTIEDEIEILIERNFKQVGVELPKNSYTNIFHLKRVLLNFMSAKFDLSYRDTLNKIRKCKYVVKEKIILRNQMDGSYFLDI